jgi:hypothetical protein
MKRAKQDRFQVYSGKDPEKGDVVIVEIGDKRVPLSPSQAWSLAGRLRSEAILIESTKREKRQQEKLRAEQEKLRAQEEWWAELLQRLLQDSCRQDDLLLLGLAPGCTAADIKATYRRRVLETHPDRGGSEEEFRRVNEAYERIRGAIFVG